QADEHAYFALAEAKERSFVQVRGEAEDLVPQPIRAHGEPIKLGKYPVLRAKIDSATDQGNGKENHVSSRGHRRHGRMVFRASNRMSLDCRNLLASVAFCMVFAA